MVAAHAQCDRPDAVAVARDELVEGDAVATRSALDEARIRDTSGHLEQVSATLRHVRTDELDYDLPAELIAQEFASERDASRLLVYRRASGALEHRSFPELVSLLDPDDLVVANTTRVVPGRLHARRASGGAVELLLLEELADGEWEALARPSRRLREGELLQVADELSVELLELVGAGRWRVRLLLGAGELGATLARVGELPLPPYVRGAIADTSRYQTVYADHPGSAAAPTAGLHFTPELWRQLAARCEVVGVELRIGLDTFRPVAVDELDAHDIHSEAYAIEPATRARIDAARADGRRVVCVGTTALRVVETVADPHAPDTGRTTLFVTPGYSFRTAGALLTNFHLPRSTLLALVMAFVGVAETRRIYAEAIAQRYRFFSLGDATLLL
jgi:S-adenosylmethionine:tRNA ribosyltransferase-isomerase